MGTYTIIVNCAVCVLGCALGIAPVVGQTLGPATKPFNSYEDIQRRMKEPRPDLNGVRSSVLQAALQDPAKLFAFITAPDTPYVERRVAAVQGAPLVSIEQMPTVVAAINELSVEEQLHHWGMRNHPMSAMGQRPISKAVNHHRVILGHPWRLSDDLLPYPLTFEEEAKEPWPRQVGAALGDLLTGMVPSGGDMPACRRWLDLAMTLPCGTPSEAEVFVKVTVAITHLKTPAVMSRWRQIMEDPEFGNGAILIAVKLGEAVQHWDDDRSRPLGQLIMLAAFQSHVAPVQADAAAQLPAMCTRPMVSGAKPA